MTNPPNSERQSPTPSQQRLWWLILVRGGLTLSGIIVIGLVGGYLWLQNFIRKDLTPIASKSLTTTLNRPVKLGNVKEFSLSGVKFAASSIPATPTDPDNATVETVEVTFNPLQFLFTRTLKLDVNLINPQVYLAQDAEGKWLSTTFTPPKRGGAFTTDLDYLRFQNAKLELVPRKQSTGEKNQNSSLTPSLPGVKFTQINGTSQLLDKNSLLKFELTGKPESGGNIALRGETRPRLASYNIQQLRAQDLAATDVARLVKLPLTLQSGLIDGDIALQWQQQETPLMQGSVNLKNVKAQVPKMPQPFNNAQGKVSFQGKDVRLENVSTSYGKIPLVAKGLINRDSGYDLTARVNAVTVAIAVETLKVKLPVPVTGEAKADLTLTGTIQKPLLAGTVTTIKPAKIDKVDFQSVGAKFAYLTTAGVMNFSQIQGKPSLGGSITGDGRLQLGTKPSLDFNLTGKNLPGDAIATLYNTKSAVKLGTVAATAKITGSPNQVQTSVDFQAPGAIYPATGQVIVNPDKTVAFRNVKLALAGGTVLAAGTWNQQRWQAVANANQIPIAPFIQPEQRQNLILDDARFNGNLALAGTSAPFQLSTIRPQNAQLRLGGGTVTVASLQWGEENFATELIADGIRLAKLFKNPLPPSLGAPLSGKFQLAGNRENISLQTLQGRGDARLAVGGGTINARNIQLAQGNYQAQVEVNQVSLPQLAAVPRQFAGKLNGQFTVAGTVDNFKPENIQATGQGRLSLGGGVINAKNIQLSNGNYRAQVQGNNLPLQRFNSPIPGLLGGNFLVAGSVNSLKPESIKATGNAQVNIAGGTVTAKNIQLANGRYQAVVTAANIALNRFSPQLRGLFAGNFQVFGNTKSFSLGNIQGQGEMAFSQGLPGIARPLTAVAAWNGSKLTVANATAPGLNARGEILVSTRKSVPEITQLNLDVQAQDYNLQELPVQLPQAIALTGSADFDGKITGKLPKPNILGQVALRNLVVNKLSVESLLRGNIEFVAGKGTILDVAGLRDKIAFNLDGNNRPRSFQVKWNQALASGITRGENLAAKLENIPLQVLNITVPAKARFAGGKLEGNLTGDVLVNLQTLAANGKLAIAQPQIGRIKGDRLAANFRYAGDSLDLTDSEFAKGASSYRLVGNFRQINSNPQIQAKLNVNQGDIQELLNTLQISSFDDLRQDTPTSGKAENLNTIPVGLPNAPLDRQLARFSEIDALLAIQEQQRLNASLIPELADLSGKFSGEVTFDNTQPNGLAVGFNLLGEQFIWGRKVKNDANTCENPQRCYRGDRIIAQGKLENNILRLIPLRIETKNRLIAFTGNIGGQEQTGKLEVVNLPMAIIDSYVKLPVKVGGNLNATAYLAGSIENPQAKGELAVTQGDINGKKLESADTSFSYNNGRLNFGSQVVVTGSSEPVTITGYVPYQVPTATTSSPDNKINMDIRVKNEGLAVLNAFTNQIAYESGKGEVFLQVRGTMKEPELNGIASLKDAIFTAQTLTGKLTEVTGNARFTLNRLIVEKLQGQYGQGSINIAGELPISNPLLPIQTPLTVDMQKLTLNLKGLYQGGVGGNLKITGAAISPEIGGQLQLDNGKILLAESSSNGSGNAANLNKANKELESEENQAFTSLKNLEIKLGKNVEIVRPPILSFRATGSLTVNGSLSNPLPEGTISLRSGDVNLFTSQFNLVRGYKNTATFTETQPRNPELDIRLITRVLDINPRQISTNSISSEINEGIITNIEPVKTVKIEAIIRGRASQLQENLELKSTPNRSQTEIIALLGGSFVETFGRGDSTLGLVNLAGSALNLQRTFTQIGSAFGLSEFRLFPTISSDDGETRRGSALDLAAEAGIDVTSNFSVSTSKILTSNKPAQFGINYRINPEIRLRTSTDFSGDNRALVEFEKRF
ncbi:translocation/assembly module TamB domain-containing protein [Calothrix sp. 336/3]|uniref:translocation/assembly module TamB domain-containing protein n=1 Tax=Calothrix sp. 336/3 TaxID=1337936 RepID=UPI0004E43793|nr:translocation/assembly module TamB domain-containing protein [Calothrix sp. 336/3]AKG20703.1 hypothetical protein IJ00_04730 [Calothrix sp. 336/3]